MSDRRRRHGRAFDLQHADVAGESKYSVGAITFDEVEQAAADDDVGRRPGELHRAARADRDIDAAGARFDERQAVAGDDRINGAAAGVDLLITAFDDGFAGYTAGVHLLDTAPAHRGGNGSSADESVGEILATAAEQCGVRCGAPAADALGPAALHRRADHSAFGVLKTAV